MGAKSTKIDYILYYYVFQKKINNYLNNTEKRKEKTKLKNGYIINPEWIKEWKRRINYNKIISEYLVHFNINSIKLSDEQKLLIKQFIENVYVFNNLCYETKTINKYNYFIIYDKLITRNFLENLVNVKTFEKLGIRDGRSFEKVKYIFKEKMFILFIEKYHVIKILLFALKYRNEIFNLINFTLTYNEINYYEDNSFFFEENKSERIMDFLYKINIFENDSLIIKDKNHPIYKIKNENYKEILKRIVAQQIPKHQGDQDQPTEESFGNNEKNKINDCKIKEPKEINFSLFNRTCYKGLDNVGATCYMNATLQCLANIKPITDYLLNPNNYNFLYQNNDLCKLTLQYIQVLIGLFLSETINGSYCPENFKKTISELNPLFQGVQANDSKDLIIFLLEIMNNELVSIHIKKHNINNNEDESYQEINISDENMVLDHFLRDFKKKYCTVIGSYLIGFNKSVFTCHNCKGNTINFNIFNLLIFSLEATSNYYNLGINNNSIPVINFSHCFGYLSKEEIFQDTYCQKCKKTGSSYYKETIYSFPLYLIIILNRGKGNIFNCHVQIPERFNASNFIDNKSQNDDYELIGIVSHFGESGMGGHFIAFCKHNIDGKWRCYNDSIVTECQNDYLNKGTPYILFYKKYFIENLNSQNSQMSNQNNLKGSLKNSFNLNFFK